jgi:hypothetical protein
MAQGYERKGTHRSSHTLAEFQGQPEFEGLHGPCWGGKGIVRYENWAACEILAS